MIATPAAIGAGPGAMLTLQAIEPSLRSGPSWMHAILVAVLALLAIAMVCCVARLVVGPTLPDRVVALDLMGMFAVGVIAIFAMLIGRPVLLSVCLIMGLILFLGTAAFALYLERRARP